MVIIAGLKDFFKKSRWTRDKSVGWRIDTVNGQEKPKNKRSGDDMKRRGWISVVCAGVAVTALSGTVFAAQAEYIGDAKAKTIALDRAGVAEDQASFTKERLGRDDGRAVYKLTFTSGGVKYSFEVDAVSGDIREYSRKADKTASASGNASQYIGETKAQSIALADAGLSESEVRKLKVKLDREDGVKVYEVEFKSGRMEYEYEIDPITGTILKSDMEYDD
jgi:uncharacterized membrane protein YkoI